MSKQQTPNASPVLFGQFNDTCVLCKPGPSVYGARNIVNQDGTIAITGDYMSLYVNSAAPANAQKLVCTANASMFPILLTRVPSDAWFVHPNLLQFMQLESYQNYTNVDDFPFVTLAPHSTYQVEASVAVDVGLYPDNFTANAHYVVLDLVWDDEALLSATTMIWSPSQTPSTRSVSLVGKVRNGMGTAMSVRLVMATSLSVCSVVPRFVKLTQVLNDF